MNKDAIKTQTMPRTIPKLNEGMKLKNEETGNLYLIDGFTYDEERCQLMYILQGQRYHFNRIKVTQATIHDNINKESYTVISDSK